MNKNEIKYKNEPPVLMLGEEIMNSITHGVGALFALVGMILLILESDTSIKIVASLIYGITMFLTMLMSCLYHAFKSKSAVKRLWRRFDYMAIYLLIAGTFAPILLVYMQSKLSLVMFIVQWFIVIFGITIIAVFGPGRWSALHFTLYFVMGWSGLIFVPYFYQYNFNLLIMIFIGGLAYTLGMIPFVKNKKYYHSIWHICVLLGAILHWVGIYWFIY